MQSSSLRSGKLVPVKLLTVLLVVLLWLTSSLPVSSNGVFFPPLTEFSSRFIFVLQVFFQHLKHFISKRDECLLTLQLPPTIGRSSNQLLSIHFLYATHILTISSLCCLCSTLQSSGPSLLLIMEILNLFTHSWHYALCFSSCPVVFLSITARSYLCLHYVVCQTALHASLRNLSLGYRILVFKECYFYTI